MTPEEQAWLYLTSNGSKREQSARVEAHLAEMRDRGDSNGISRFRHALASNIATLNAEANAESAAQRAHISPLAGLAHQVTNAPPTPPVFGAEYMSPERRAERARLNPLLAMADALEEQQRRARGG